MSTDEQLIEPEKSHENAVRLYRRHYWTRILFYGLAAGLASYLFSPTLGALNKGDGPGAWAIYLGALLVLFFLVEWGLAVAFKRKSRPWRLRKDPADRDPRS